jgi:hypothetical protein
MTDEQLGPEILSTRGVPSARRGYDKRVIDGLLSEAAKHWAVLARQHSELLDSVEKSGGLEFLGREMSQVAAEVGAILESAKKAADGMRTRAREDAERLEREAATAAEAVVAQADRQAFELRKDAWETGADLLEDALDEAARIIVAGSDDALMIRAQGEKDAHRQVAAARKEGDDLIRTARYEADRQLNQAREVAQEIIDRAAAPYTESGDIPDDPVSEQRRRELLAEIEQLRAQRSVDAVEVFATDQTPTTRRRSGQRARSNSGGIDLSDQLAAEVAEMRGGPPPPKVLRIMTNDKVQFGTDDDVGTLFEALRTTGEVDEVELERREPLSTDPFELREQLLLPVINGGVRESKRRVVDLQNVALAGLRSSGWHPEASVVVRELRGALEPMIHKAASAGARAAGPLAGVMGAMSAPGDRAARLMGDMAAALTGQLGAAVDEGGGPEVMAAAISRVFRDWRTDTAERWSRLVAFAAYHDSLLSALSDGGVEEVVGVGTGSACDVCPSREGLHWVPGGVPPNGTAVPPARIDCGCSFIPAVG